MADCRNCGGKLPTFTFGELSDLCRSCRRIREEQRKRFAATNEYDFFTETLGPHRATMGLMAISIIVFAAMAYAGVSVLDPATHELISRGANYGPKTLGEHQYWRLLTCGFIHIGLLHIVLNMVCVWSLSKQLEDLFGSLTTVGVYVATAIGGSMLSLSWDPYRVSAGASGAIFGIAGTLLVFLFYGKHDLTAAERTAELSSVAKFALINLLLGLRAHTDNMAHLGGLVTGAGIGLLLSRRTREQQKALPTFQFAAVAMVLAGILASIAHAKQPQMSFVAAMEAMTNGDCKKAIRTLSKEIGSHRQDADAHGLLGYCYEREKQIELAQTEYETALRVDPALGYVHEDLGHLLVGKKLFAEAIPHYEVALKEEPDEFASFNDYAGALFEVGRYPEAEAILRKSIESKNDDAGTHRNLARVLKTLGKIAEADEEAKKAAALEEMETAAKTASTN